MKYSLGEIFQRVRHSFKYRLVIYRILTKLAHFGIEIAPYYVFREGLFIDKLKRFGHEFEEYETSFLGAEDMKKIGNIDGRSASEKELCKRLQKGNKCFALKMDGEIVGFTWCNFDVFDHPPDSGVKLKEDEAYLFDAYTLKAYRGHKLAPFMRYRCYEELAKTGRNILYSYSDYFNTPAIRFKDRLDARLLRLCLYIQLFKKFSWQWQLRTYTKHAFERNSRAIGTKKP